MTPNMEDFFVSDLSMDKLALKVKNISKKKGFSLNRQGHNRIWVFSCRHSPYFNMPSMCPFKLRYCLNKEQTAYVLLDYDEMHNHELVENPQCIPFPSRYRSLAKFPTPNFQQNFGKIKAASVNELKDFLNKLGSNEYNFPINVQTSYQNNKAFFYCGLKAWASTEAQLMQTM